MKLIELSKGYFAEVDDQDFDWLSKNCWSAACRKNYVYAKMANSSKKYMHRVILGLTDPKLKVDHIDGNGLNNQRSNLRVASNSENISNSIKFRRKTSSKFKGVCFHKNLNKWAAMIHKNKTRYYLGLFENEIEAAIAYNKKAIELHGEFANLNKFYYHDTTSKIIIA